MNDELLTKVMCCVPRTVWSYFSRIHNTFVTWTQHEYTNYLVDTWAVQTISFQWGVYTKNGGSKKDRTVTDQHYASLENWVGRQMPSMAHKKVLLRYDKAPADSCAIRVLKLIELDFFNIPLLPKFGSLGPLPLPNMKKWLMRKRFYSNEAVIAEAHMYFAGLVKVCSWKKSINWSCVGRSL